MILARLFSAALLVLTLLNVAPAAADTDGPDRVVEAAVNEVIQRFGGKTLSPDDCVAGLGALIDTYGDLGLTTGRILGYHWNKADQAQKSDLTKLVRDYLIGSWAGHLNDVPTGHQFHILGAASSEDNRAIVQSVLITPDGDVPVDWTVERSDGGRNVITDIKVEGVSMVQTLRSDFTAVIRANDGKIQPLIEALRNKIRSY
ncbi:MAG TPA: ABC transporter substrate-binding protein [Rhodospirillaceae bacterium]|nr:ABC transporter substrate-binding protein [Rhodospirillaceae bacterium]